MDEVCLVQIPGVSKPSSCADQPSPRPSGYLWRIALEIDQSSRHAWWKVEGGLIVRNLSYEMFTPLE